MQQQSSYRQDWFIGQSKSIEELIKYYKYLHSFVMPQINSITKSSRMKEYPAHSQQIYWRYSVLIATHAPDRVKFQLAPQGALQNDLFELFLKLVLKGFGSQPINRDKSKQLHCSNHPPQPLMSIKINLILWGPTHLHATCVQFQVNK